MPSQAAPVGSAKVLTPSDHPTRFSEVLATIGLTQKIMVICGENICLAEGLLPLGTPLPGPRGQGLPNTLRGLLDECSPATIPPELLQPEKLAALNAAMTTRRIAARSAPLTKFHDLLGQLFDQDRLVSCLTESFDGVEERCRTGFSDCLVMLYGDNRQLCCCTPRCRTTPEGNARQWDEWFLDGKRVLCSECHRINIKTSKERRKGTDATRALRPTVQCSLGARMLVGQDRQEMKKAAEMCQLLLIIGISFKDPNILDLTRELGEVIRSNYGGVVYVNPQPLRGGQSTHDHIDFHLQVEPEVVVDGLLSVLNKPNNESMLIDGEDHTADMWFDLISNDIPFVTCPEEPEYTAPRCAYCNCSIIEYLISCTKCSLRFCYRRADHLTELNAGTARETSGGASISDPFTYDLSCLVFDRYKQEEFKRTLESIRSDFVCPDCWEFKSFGLYPHFVRGMPRLTIEESGKPLPRMVMLIFYLEQFWPVTKQLCAALSGRWKNTGWPCHVVPLKLESLAEQQNMLSHLTWEERSFDIMVVYLTHGLSGEQGYQIGHRESHRGAQFLELTLKLWQELLNKARTKRAFFLCCGHPLLSPRMVREMQVWIESSGALDSVAGCLNRKMSPGFMVNMMAKMSMRLVEQVEWAWETMFEVWLTDSIARTHSDLLCLAPGRRAEMWLYAPFQSRPLGKPLPDLLEVCQCPKFVERSNIASADPVPRKQWKVTHEGKAGRPINEIKVKATCSRCKQFWQLPSTHMVGDLMNMGGQYGVRIPYFVSKNI